MKRAVIIGNGIIANLCALYLRKRLDGLAEVVIVGPESRGGLPVVGESTIEISAGFMEELGLGEYLRTTHYPKYGLTYYFQLDPSKPEARTYSVHCNEAAVLGQKPLPGWQGPWARPPAWLVNRDILDRDLRDLVTRSGVERIEGVAEDVTVDGASGHTLRIREPAGERAIHADWLIDASGRQRFLARRESLSIRSEGQRDCFWFRLRDFDRSHLKQLNALGPEPPGPGEPYHHERYFTTHHFFGRGNWIWLIPIRAPDGSELISVGLTSHPEHYRHEVNSMETFLELVRAEHPCVADFVESGSVVDTNRLRRYHYLPARVYSPQQRWCVIGDAGYALDPLFSNGLAFSSMQIRQIGEMISRDVEGHHDPEYVDALSRALLAPLKASQDAISDWYGTMHDAYLANLRLYWIEISYFYMFLPSVHNRCYYDPERLSLWQQMFGLRETAGNSRFELPQPLLESRKRFAMPGPEHFFYMGKEKVNPRALEEVTGVEALVEQFREGQRVRTRLLKKTMDAARHPSR